jgi:SAM-dependent methyltransferase
LARLRWFARRVLRRLRGGSQAGLTTRRALRGVPGGTYPPRFRVEPPPPPVEGPWPAWPVSDAPAAAATNPLPEPVRSYDLALFEELNAEYASKPLVRDAPAYDHDSLVERSTRRLTGVHNQIGLAGLTTLEVGCGSGYEVWGLAHAMGCDAWGIDILPRQAWETLRGDRVHLVAGDIAVDHGLPLGTFDRVLSFTVWEHITHPQTAIHSLYEVMKPGGLAYIRANLHRGPKSSHRYRDIFFPFPHLLFPDDVIAAGLARRSKPALGAAWVNRLTWEQYEATIIRAGFVIRSVLFDVTPLDVAFYRRFEDVLGRYPREDLERDYFTAVLERPVSPS